MKKILFLVPYPKGQAPSQRFRFEQYFDILSERGFELEIRPFLDEKTWHNLYSSGKDFSKLLGVISGFAKRIGDVFRAIRSDFVFIHREASPIGPPVYEWVISKVVGKKVIYDFDDAIWMPNTSAENKLIAGLKWHDKVSSICRWSWKVSAGNSFLRDFAAKYNPNAQLNPTSIDTVNLHVPGSDKEIKKTVVIGWTGTHSTSKYLKIIEPVLKKLEEKFTFKFLVISNRAHDLDVTSLEFKPWNKESEIQDLREIDIGVMPLSDDPWAKGKCGFKALQFMALEIPVVVSPVGVNKEIVENGVNGLLASNENEWYDHLSQLLTSPDKREKLGMNGRQKVIDSYSVDSNERNFISLFTD